MTLAPIFQASFCTQLHVFAAIGAFVLMPIVVTVAGVLLDVAILLRDLSLSLSLSLSL